MKENTKFTLVPAENSALNKSLPPGWVTDPRQQQKDPTDQPGSWGVAQGTGPPEVRGRGRVGNLGAAGGPGALLLPGTQPPYLPTARAHGSQLAGDLNTETGSKDSPNKPG